MSLLNKETPYTHGMISTTISHDKLKAACASFKEMKNKQNKPCLHPFSNFLEDSGLTHLSIRDGNCTLQVWDQVKFMRARLMYGI
jgi:hypothetical protein